MQKIINPCKFRNYNEKLLNTFVKISYVDGKLSLTGVEAPTRDGNCHGSCGQIYDSLDSSLPAEGFTSEMVEFLREVWKAYHLNDMQSGCNHQREMGITYRKNPNHVCLICGYKIGSAWLKKEVPSDVIKWLESLPDTTVTPAWV